MNKFENIKVKVYFTQHGTWGAVGFTGELFFKKNDMLDIFKMFEMDKPNDQEEYIPVITITEGLEQYIGLTLKPNEIMPGLYGDYGKDNPLSNKCYIGDMKIGDSANDLKEHKLPPVMFPSKISYIHIGEEEQLTEEQKAMLLEAVRFDRENRFSPGATATRLFTREELEGEMQGRVFYA